MSDFWLFTTSTAFLLYLALLHFLFRSHLRQYFILFSYLVVLLLTGIVDVALAYGGVAELWDQPRNTVFYFNDLVRQTLVYVLVISMILSAVRGSERFSWMGPWLVVAAVLLAGFSLWFHHEPDIRIPLWMTNVVRNLSFTASLMILLLWLLLVVKRTSDRTLLMVATGLGLQMAGEAIGQSLRLISPRTLMIGNVVSVLSHLLCLLVWFAAFRRKRPASGPRPAH